ncbi:MAG: chloramphenicol acetyltransferase [Ruminococcus sp.]|nr:chloramphenicol acetyltransferase [Ruminococcus sp.]
MCYKIIDMNSYYRKDIFNHFSVDCKCSFAVTARVDVTDLKDFSKRTGTSFYLNFLYVLSKTLNSREDYRFYWDYQTRQMRLYDRINPRQYVFHEDTETITVVYSEYFDDYKTFYNAAKADLEKGKSTREYGLDDAAHPNWFDASSLPWLSFDSMTVELPDGYLYFNPIVNWGKFREENGRLMMPVAIRLNHASADGFLAALFYKNLEKEISGLCEQ